ncbi:hypothetical protein DITRI_Ditri14bG0118500 [Diplodiscus trichospermus]
MKVDKGSITTFDAWWAGLLLSFKQEGADATSFLTSISFVCWGIWKERCNAVFKFKPVDIHFAINRVRETIFEFRNLSVYNPHRMSPSCAGSSTAPEHWTAPPMGIFKINCDGSFK